MSDNGDQAQVQLSWPLPPEHYKEAANLEPPPIPDDGHYEYLAVYQTPIFETFRTQFAALERDVNLLYDSNNFKPGDELKKLNMSLLFNFLELIEKLKDPEKYESIINDKIGPILKNMHHLLNMYRPHQARQTLIALMEQQIERRKAFLKSIVERMERSEKVLQRAKKNITAANSATVLSGVPKPAKNGASLTVTAPLTLPLTQQKHDEMDIEAIN